MDVSEPDATTKGARYDDWAKRMAKSKEAQRSNAALLIRMLTIRSLVIPSGKEVLLMVPWFRNSKGSLMASDLIDNNIKDTLTSSRYEVSPWQGDAAYEVVTNMSVDLSTYSLEDVIT